MRARVRARVCTGFLAVEVPEGLGKLLLDLLVCLLDHVLVLVPDEL